MSRIPPRLVHAYINGSTIRASNCLLRPRIPAIHRSAPTATTTASRHLHTTKPLLRDRWKCIDLSHRQNTSQGEKVDSEDSTALNRLIDESKDVDAEHPLSPSPALPKKEPVPITRWDIRAPLPLPQSVKELNRQRRDEKAAEKAAQPKIVKADQEEREDWECTIGIEIHAQLNTSKKLFSTSPNVNGAPPNTTLSFFDLALPGSQPEFQKETLIPAVRAALALGCEINRESGWDRKHYFHWDQPSGYQITQFYKPFAQNGSITLYPHDGIAAEDISALSASAAKKGLKGKKKEAEGLTVKIKQVQMEQDTAKTIKKGNKIWLDFNRVGTPLIEIITGPDIHYPSTAAALVRKIQNVLVSVDACVLGMEQGGLRADVNVSVRRKGEVGNAPEYNGVSGLGTRTEIKNLSSFKSIRDAIIIERDRQIAVLEEGGVIEGETRGFNIGGTETIRLRGKEGEVDYRYMPDADLPPLLIGEDLIEHLRGTMGVLPDEQLEELTREFGVSRKDASSLVGLDEGWRAEYFYEVLEMLARRLKESGTEPAVEGVAASEGDEAVEETQATEVSKAAEKTQPAEPSKEIIQDPAFNSKHGPNVSNWILHELGGMTSRLGADGEAMQSPVIDLKYMKGQCMVPAREMAELLYLLEMGKITRKTAKYVLGELYKEGVEAVQGLQREEEVGGRTEDLRGRDWTEGLESAKAVIEREELWFQPMTHEEYRALARRTAEDRLWVDIVGTNVKRREGKIRYWLGKVMWEAGERADARMARRAVEEIIGEEEEMWGWEYGMGKRNMGMRERGEVEEMRRKLKEMGRVVNRRLAAWEKREMMEDEERKMEEAKKKEEEAKEKEEGK